MLTIIKLNDIFNTILLLEIFKLVDKICMYIYFNYVLDFMYNL
jgi:hypothetical protein